MKNITFIILFAAAFSLSANAQIVEELQETPFSNDRINYFKRTFVAFNEYLDTENGYINTTDMRVILPFGKTWNFRADLPLVSKSTNGETATGLGDVSFGVANTPYLNEKRGVAFRVRIISDSSTDHNLGSGKWIAVPSIFYGQYLDADNKYLWLSILENFSSFAGSDNRKHVETTCYENLIVRYFGKNWIGADVTFRYNGTVKGYQNNAYLEYGRKITPNNMAYIHPSIAFGDKKSYNYGLEAGVLILF
ncbi:lipid A phosphoethanolamine transferase [Flavobacteriaceae bacterium CRH]|nr:lipid A phosphoethanolamine transferase [Flavobacteriaceae bacterium CRH]